MLRAPSSLLDSFEAERKPVAQRNTQYAKQFADSVGLFVAKPELEEDSVDGELERARASRYLDAHARLEFNIPGVTFGARYDGSPIILDDGTPAPPDTPSTYQPTAKPGGRPPHMWLEDGRSLFDLFHDGWTLLAIGDDAPATAAFELAARALAMDLRVLRLARPGLRELYEAPLILIRPDQIVAWRGSAATGAKEVLSKCAGSEFSSRTQAGPDRSP